MTERLGDLDDPDYPAYTTGRAAEVLGAQQASLRSGKQTTSSLHLTAGPPQ